ncbi:MAG: ATP-binding protein [Candidatus Heimdallarchaeota archaeon]|nr:ATP-binding protein [Candidatus Heimdallarchaeota archaeon]
MMNKKNNVPTEALRKLRLYHLLEHWNDILNEASSSKSSYSKFLTSLIEQEYQHKLELERLARIQRAIIPTQYTIETYPFAKQPNLDQKLIMEVYDSMNYVQNNKDLIFIGPTGCGKTGLATSFLLQALNNGLRGYFIDFSGLINILHRSKADFSSDKTVQMLVNYDILLIDELGYMVCEKEQASLFFDLLRRRHGKTSTIITTQLGFGEWGSFLKNQHIVAALLDRITENCIVFNMKDCISIRQKQIVYANK